jgi:hypothetical protein
MERRLFADWDTGRLYQVEMIGEQDQQEQGN